MWLAPQWLQPPFERVERRARQAHDLLSAVEHEDAAKPRNADDHDIAIIITAIGGRAAGEPGVRCMRAYTYARDGARRAEGRVGKDGVGTCASRGGPVHEKNK